MTLNETKKLVIENLSGTQRTDEIVEVSLGTLPKSSGGNWLKKRVIKSLNHASVVSYQGWFHLSISGLVATAEDVRFTDANGNLIKFHGSGNDFYIDYNFIQGEQIDIICFYNNSNAIYGGETVSGLPSFNSNITWDYKVEENWNSRSAKLNNIRYDMKDISIGEIPVAESLKYKADSSLKFSYDLDDGTTGSYENNGADLSSGNYADIGQSKVIKLTGLNGITTENISIIFELSTESYGDANNYIFDSGTNRFVISVSLPQQSDEVCIYDGSWKSFGYTNILNQSNKYKVEIISNVATLYLNDVQVGNTVTTTSRTLDSSVIMGSTYTNFSASYVTGRLSNVEIISNSVSVFKQNTFSVKDLSGNNNYGERIGGQEETTFDGVDNYIDVNDFVSGTNSFSISAYINPTSVSGIQPIYANWGGFGTSSYLFRVNAGILQFYIQTQNAVYTITEQSISAGVLTHVTAVYDGSTIKTYKNGVSSSTVSASGTILIGSTPDGIGKYGTTYYDGNITEVNILNKAITQAEVTQISTHGIEYQTVKERLKDTVIMDLDLTENVGGYINYGADLSSGEYAEFDGTNYIKISNLDMNKVFEISVKYKFYDKAYSHQAVFQFIPNAENGNQNYIDGISYTSNNNVRGSSRYVPSGDVRGEIIPSLVLENDVWYNYKFISDGTDVELFINNISQGTDALDATLNSFLANLYLGKTYNNAYYFKGAIKDLEVKSNNVTLFKTSNFKHKDKANTGIGTTTNIGNVIFEDNVAKFGQNGINNNNMITSDIKPNYNQDFNLEISASHNSGLTYTNEAFYRHSGTGRVQLMLDGSSNKLRWNVVGTSGTIDRYDGVVTGGMPSMVANQTYKFNLIRTGNLYEFYMDDVLIDSLTQNLGTISPTEDIVFGGVLNNTLNFNGNLSNVTLTTDVIEFQTVNFKDLRNDGTPINGQAGSVFDGNNQSVLSADVKDVEDINRSYTLNTDFNILNNTTNQLLSHYNAGGLDNGTYMQADGTIVVRFMGSAQASSPLSYDDGNNHNVTISYNGSIGILYIDGVNILTGSGASNDRGNKIQIGELYNGAYDTTGNITQTQLFNKRLTQEEVTELVTNGIEYLASTVVVATPFEIVNGTKTRRQPIKNGLVSYSDMEGSGADKTFNLTLVDEGTFETGAYEQVLQEGKYIQQSNDSSLTNDNYTFGMWVRNDNQFWSATEGMEKFSTGIGFKFKGSNDTNLYCTYGHTTLGTDGVFNIASKGNLNDYRFISVNKSGTNLELSENTTSSNSVTNANSETNTNNLYINYSDGVSGTTNISSSMYYDRSMTDSELRSIIISEGALIDLQFEGNSLDSSMNNRTTTQSNGIFINEDGTNCLDLSGNTGYVTIDDEINLENYEEMTLFARCKFNDIGVSDTIYMYGETTVSPFSQTVFKKVNDTLQFEVRYSNTLNNVITTNAIIEIDKWYSIGATKDKTGLMKVYLDGIEVGSLQGTSGFNVPDVSFVSQIGSNNVDTTTVYGATATTDRNNIPNSALNHTNSQYVSVPNLEINYNSGFTLSIWVKFASISGTQNIMSFQESNYIQGYLNDLTSGFTFALYTGSSWTYVSDTSPSTNWTNYIFTFDGSTGILYKNGTNISSFTGFGTIASIIGTNRIGASGGGLNGKSDEPRVWSKGLNSYESEISYDSYNQPGLIASSLNYGQIAYYKMDVDANDSSGNGNHLTVTGATLTTGKINQGYSFDGNDYIIEDVAQTIGTQFSINVWFKNNFSGATRTIAARRQDSSNIQWQLYQQGDADKIRMYYYDGGNSLVGTLESPLSYNDNVWHMVTITQNGDNVVMYIDGSSVDTDSTAGKVSDSQKLELGSYNSGTGSYWIGSLDAAGIWNKGLSSPEVLELYNNSTGNQYPYPQVAVKPIGQESYYKFDGDYVDATGNSNTITAYGSPTFTTGKINNGVNLVSSSTQWLKVTQVLSRVASINLWANSSDITGNEFLVTHRTSNSNNDRMYIYTNNSDVNFTMGSVTLNLPGILTTGWHMYTMTWNEGSAICYIDGVQVGTISYTPFNFGAFWNLGALTYVDSTTVGQLPFNGIIDEVGVCSRTLTPKKILELYNIDGVGNQYPYTLVETKLIGQIAYYKFDGNADDSSGNGNHATVTGATLTTGKINQGYLFNGSDTIQASVSIPHMSNFTISGWMYFNSQQYANLLGLNNTGSGSLFLATHPSGYIYYFERDDSGNTRYTKSTTTTLTNNTWYHLALVKDGTHNDIRLYINNVLQNESIVTGGNPNTSVTYTSLSIGNTNTMGIISDVGLWDRNLIPREIFELYNVNAIGNQYPYSAINLNPGLVYSSNFNNGTATNSVGQGANAFDGLISKFKHYQMALTSEEMLNTHRESEQHYIRTKIDSDSVGVYDIDINYSGDIQTPTKVVSSNIYPTDIDSNIGTKAVVVTDEIVTTGTKKTKAIFILN